MPVLPPPARSPEPIAPSDAHAEPPRWHPRGVFGLELFNRAASPWAALSWPLPIASALLMLVVVTGTIHWPWLAWRAIEVAYLCWMPFFLSAGGQAIARHLSNAAWKNKTNTPLDYSPRAWHYVVAVGVCALPLVLLQFVPAFLDSALLAFLRVQSMLAFGAPAQIGYDPDAANLLTLGVLPVVFWQVKRSLLRIPSGRLLGMQRELTRLRGSVAWDTEAWAHLVGDCFDRWLMDVQPLPGKRRARQTAAWQAFRRETIQSYQRAPWDLVRANQALWRYRQAL
jgi:hypothetical protein